MGVEEGEMRPELCNNVGRGSPSPVCATVSTTTHCEWSDSIKTVFFLSVSLPSFLLLSLLFSLLS